MELTPPDIVLLGPERPERALLRAQLIEEGYERRSERSQATDPTSGIHSDRATGHHWSDRDGSSRPAVRQAEVTSSARLDDR
jgi:hypothetical protein